MIKVSAETKTDLLNQMVALTNERADQETRYGAIDRLREILSALDDRAASAAVIESAVARARIHSTVWVDRMGADNYAAYDHEGKPIMDTNDRYKSNVEGRVRAMISPGGHLEHVAAIATVTKGEARQPGRALPQRPARRMRAGDN